MTPDTLTNAKFGNIKMLTPQIKLYHKDIRLEKFIENWLGNVYRKKLSGLDQRTNLGCAT